MTAIHIVHTIKVMLVEFDPAKNESNIAKHGLSLQRAEDFDLTSLAIEVDDREDYGEVRYRAIGLIGANFYSLVFTMRGEVLRAISLRRSTKQEVSRYAEEF